MSEVEVIKPRSKFDRQMARIEQMRVWEYVSKSIADDVQGIDFLLRLAEEAYGLSNISGTTPAQQLRAMQACADFIIKAHQIRKETFHDRTIPTLARVDVTDAIRRLPGEDEDVKQGDELAQFRQKLGQDLAALCHARIVGVVQPILPAVENGDGTDG